MNTVSLDRLCATLAYAVGIEKPVLANEKIDDFAAYIDKTLDGGKADRIFMYNPEAIAHWVSDKYPDFIPEVKAHAPYALPLRTVMPSVTPVCFGTMYTGTQPDVHGIKKYEKPVIKVDSLFDAMLRAGKKCAIVCTDGDSLSRIYNERNMDYFYYRSIEEVNAKAAELILSDEHDLIVVYNGDYDGTMHRWGPEHPLSLGALRANARTFAEFAALIETHWQKHNTVLGFAMDHGCHEIDGGCGSHGLDMDEDMDILHFYKAIKGE